MKSSTAKLLLLILLAASPANAQAIRGHLIEDSNQSPVGGATITVLIGETRRSQVLTGDDGSFFIGLDAWGTYQLEAMRIGYRTTISQSFLVEPSDTVTVDFRVLPDAVLLNPILVTTRSNRGRDTFQRRMEDWGEAIFITPAMEEIRNHTDEVFNGEGPANLLSIHGSEAVQRDFLPEICGIVNFWTRVGW